MLRMGMYKYWSCSWGHNTKRGHWPVRRLSSPHPQEPMTWIDASNEVLIKFKTPKKVPVESLALYNELYYGVYCTTSGWGSPRLSDFTFSVALSQSGFLIASKLLNASWLFPEVCVDTKYLHSNLRKRRTWHGNSLSQTHLPRPSGKHQDLGKWLFRVCDVRTDRGPHYPLRIEVQIVSAVAPATLLNGPFTFKNSWIFVCFYFSKRSFWTTLSYPPERQHLTFRSVHTTSWIKLGRLL